MKDAVTNYDFFADKYAKASDTKGIHTYYERPNTWALLPASLKNLKTLDAGCGSGWYTEQLIKAGATVTAIDASAEMVKMTALRTNHQAACSKLNLEDISTAFPKKSFDLIVAPLVIHYVKDWKKLFSDFAALLVDNGILVFSTHQAHTVSQLFQLDSYFNEQLIEDHWDDPPVTVHYYHHTLHELADSLYQAGFLIERILEPYPSDELIDTCSLYEKMLKNPWFLFIRAVKKIPSHANN